MGNTPFAYPGLVFGHNDTISWGATAGFGDDVDIFAEKLDPKRPDYYQHQGQWVKMLSRTETIDEAVHQAEYQNRGTENDMIVFGAQGNEVQAWDVVAPGQSGFVAPDGTAAKHYRDQLEMYKTFGRKPLWLNDKEVNAHKESEEVIQVAQ